MFFFAFFLNQYTARIRTNDCYVYLIKYLRFAKINMRINNYESRLKAYGRQVRGI